MNANLRHAVSCAASLVAALLSSTLLPSASLSAAEPVLPPLVEESVDEIVVVQGTPERYGRIVFLRGGRILDDRLLIPERMAFSTSGDGFTVEWDDFATGPAFRRVSAARMTFGLPATGASESRDEVANVRLAWWGQDVNTTRLKRP